MSKENRIIVLLMVVILFISWRSYSNTKDLRVQLQQVNGEINNVRYSVSNEVAGIRSTVEGMRDDTKWWGQSQFDFIERDNNKIDVKIGWYLKEYTENSEVFLNYRFGEDEKFNEVKAQMEADGYFTALIPVEIKRKPLWYMGISRIGERSTNRSREMAVEEVREKEERYQPLVHYVVVKEDGKIKSSEMKNIGMEQINAQLFGVIDGHIEFHEGSNTINVDLFGKFMYEKTTSYKIEGFQLETRNNTGAVIESWDSEILDNGEHYRIEAKPEKEYDAVYVVAIYSNGDRVEKRLE